MTRAQRATIKALTGYCIAFVVVFVVFSLFVSYVSLAFWTPFDGDVIARTLHIMASGLGAMWAITEMDQ